MSLQVKLLLKDNVAPPSQPPPPPPPIRTLSDNKTKKWQEKRFFFCLFCYFLLIFIFCLEKKTHNWKYLYGRNSVYWINQFMMWKQKMKSNRKIRPFKSKYKWNKKKLPLYFLLKQNVTHKTQYYNNEKY